MSAHTLVAVDSETYLIGPGAVAPKLVCITLASRNPATGEIESRLFGNGDAELNDVLDNLFADPEIDLVFHNAAYDLTVFAAARPSLLPAIFAALEAGRITDTKIREKLLNLSTHGKVDHIYPPSGGRVPIKYSLSTLVMNYFGRDRSAEKVGDDIWRLNYSSLDGYKGVDYPAPAREYALQDVVDTLLVHEAQQKRVLNDRGPSSVRTAEFHTAADFCLRLMTCWGMSIDPEMVAKMDAQVAAELTPEKLNLLIQSGILRPAQSPRPHKNSAALAEEVRGYLPATATPEELYAAWAAAGVKLTKGQKESVNEKALHAHVEAVSKTHGITPKLTDTGMISADSEVQELLAPLDPIMAQFQGREKLKKLFSTYLPKLRGTLTMHADYDVLKETGRTSSYGGDLYPSHNVQQEDPRTRPCFVARPGHVIVSVDYSAIELVSFAQVTYSLFGHSVHRDLINQGVDLHAYLATQLAVRKHEGLAEMCRVRQLHKPLEQYELFKSLKTADPDFYDHWRGFAKPPGLGLPGGMGAETFVSFARGYGINLSVEEAQQIKDIWLETYPEAAEYFSYVQSDLGDPNNADSDGRSLFAYLSPLGMYRAGATYCAAANGNALQTPTAEGAKAAVFNVARACYDETRGSILFGSRPLAFIHDQILVEVPEDDSAHDKALDIARLMVESMQIVMPDLEVRAEPVLMRRWFKKAKPVFDTNGRLQVWRSEGEDKHEPEKEAKAA